MTPARPQRLGLAGMTLMEIMVTMAIIGLVLGGAAMGFRSVLKSDLRSAAGQLSGGIRYSYDRAVSTGAFYRIHFNLDEQTYRLERSDDRAFIRADKEKAGRKGKGLDQDEEARRELAEIDKRNGAGSQPNLPKELLPPPSPKKPRFEQFQDTTLKTVFMKKGVKLLDVYTPRQEEPYVSGHAYLHFFPDGHTERAVIHLGTDRDDEANQFTLLVNGLTGRVDVRTGRVMPPKDFDYATEVTKD